MDERSLEARNHCNVTSCRFKPVRRAAAFDQSSNPDTYIGPEQEHEDAQHPEYSREKSMSIACSEC